MDQSLNHARRSLLRAQEAARQRLAALDQERRELKASLKSLEAALKAIDKPRPGPTARPMLERPAEPGDMEVDRSE